jgi:glycosyltransferase involved in cell wall biosynthesis
VLVVDDGSTDTTREQVKRYSANSRLDISLLATGGRGAGAARNEGLAQVTTQLVAFLDADDIWYPTKLERQAPLVDEGRIVGSLMHYLSPSGAVLGANARFESYESATEALRAARVMPLALSSWLLPTKQLTAAGGFDETFRRAQDFELGVRLANAGMSLAWPLEDVLLGYLIHASGVSATSYREQFLAAELVRFRLANDIAPEYASWVHGNSHSARIRRRALSGNYYRRAAVRAGEGNTLGKWAAGALAVALDPPEVLSKLKWRRTHRTNERFKGPPRDVLDLLGKL